MAAARRWECRVRADPGLSSFVGEEVAKSDRPELTSAKIIVSGGRACRAARILQIYRALADKLGAGVGASRAAVDCRLRPERLAGRPDRQGGGAGTLCRDRHLRRDPASRRHEDSKVIVAINKDEDAPISRSPTTAWSRISIRRSRADRGACKLGK